MERVGDHGVFIYFTLWAPKPPPENLLFVTAVHKIRRWGPRRPPQKCIYRSVGPFHVSFALLDAFRPVRFQAGGLAH